jgi:hypothetical protein
MLLQKSALLFQVQGKACIHSDFPDIPIWVQMKILFMQQFRAKSQANDLESGYAVIKNPAVKGRWCDRLDDAVRDDVINQPSKTDCKGF